MLNIIDDAFYTLDESVRSVRDLIENMRDDAPVDLCGGVRRQNPVLESRVREEGCVLCKHLLTVSSSLKGPEGNLEISLHFPSQRTNPFRQADFSKVIQSRSSRCSRARPNSLSSAVSGRRQTSNDDATLASAGLDLLKIRSSDVNRA
jgi:hypothetical protein